MKKLLLFSAAACAVCAAPSFADAQGFTATGCYVGVHVGYGLGRDRNAFGTVIDNGTPDFAAAEAGACHPQTNGRALRGETRRTQPWRARWVGGRAGGGGGS